MLTAIAIAWVLLWVVGGTWIVWSEYHDRYGCPGLALLCVVISFPLCPVFIPLMVAMLVIDRAQCRKHMAEIRR